jgi:general secretion pathway protein F
LEQVLFRLADLQERQVRLQKRVMSAMMYPCVLALFGVAVVIILMVAIMPRLTDIFEQQGADLPRITTIVIGVSDFLIWYWWALVLAIACLVILMRAWIARPEGRKRWDRLKLRVPLYGNLQTKLICAHFARTLGTMLESGLTMMVGLDVVKSVVQNKVVEEAIDEVKASVRRGQDLAQPLKDANLFPPMLVHMTDLGQRSGQLETMLLKVSDTYEEDVELTVDALVSIIEPVIIVIMAVFVGILVVSILLPILQMTQNVRG